MRYKFSEEKSMEIPRARKQNRDKQADKRLQVLALRCEGKGVVETASVTGFHRPTSATSAGQKTIPLSKAVRIVDPESINTGMKKALADIAARYEYNVFDRSSRPVISFREEKKHLPQRESAMVILPLLSDCAVRTGLRVV